MHCCALGGTGFIGRHLVRKLLGRGHTVSILSRAALDGTLRNDLGFPTEHVRWVVGEFTDSTAIANALEGADQCFHMVSTTLPQSIRAHGTLGV